MRTKQSQIWPFEGRFNTKKMVPSCRLHVRQVPHRDNGGCPPSLHLEATQLSLSLYVSDPSWVATLLPKPRVSVCKWVSLCLVPLRGCLGFQPSSISPGWTDGIWFSLLHVVGTLLSGIGTLGLGDKNGAGTPSLYSGDLGCWGVPPSAQLLTTCGFGVSPFCISTPPTSLYVAFYLYL